MSSSGERRRPDLFTLFLAVAATILAVLVVLLARQNIALKRQMTELTEVDLPENALKPGDELGSLVLVDQAGDAEPLEFDGGGKTLLLVFSIQCPACEQTLPIWERLVRRVPEGSSLRVLGVQLDRPADPEADPGALLTAALPFEVYGVDYERSESLDGIPSVPATVIVGPGGIVEQSWFGVPDGDDRDEMRRAVAAAG